jgi:hypothetical protein
VFEEMLHIAGAFFLGGIHNFKDGLWFLWERNLKKYEESEGEV